MLPMSKSILFRPRVRLAAFGRTFRTRIEGVAAVEFALIAPILATLFVGSVELSQAVTVNRRITQVGSTTGDLVARVNATIADTDVLDIMKVGSFLLTPFPTTPLKVTISLIGSSTTDATNTKLIWSCAYDASNTNNIVCSCPSPKTAISIPAGLVGVNDYVVISNVSYGYKPALFDVFMKQYYGGSGGIYTMKETVYLKPRSAFPSLTIGGTACPIA